MFWLNPAPAVNRKICCSKIPFKNKKKMDNIALKNNQMIKSLLLAFHLPQTYISLFTYYWNVLSSYSALPNCKIELSRRTPTSWNNTHSWTVWRTRDQHEEYSEYHYFYFPCLYWQQPTRFHVYRRSVTPWDVSKISLSVS